MVSLDSEFSVRALSVYVPVINLCDTVDADSQLNVSSGAAYLQ